MTKSSSEFFESSSIQSSDGGIVSSQFSIAIFERETSAQIGEGLTCAKRLCKFNRFKSLHVANDNRMIPQHRYTKILIVVVVGLPKKDSFRQ